MRYLDERFSVGATRAYADNFDAVFRKDPRRLADLNPRWFASEGRSGQGIVFDCPGCRRGVCAYPSPVARLAIAFDRPLDGGAPISLAPGLLYPVFWPDEKPGRFGAERIVPPGIHWHRGGDTFETLSIAPSVDASGAGHWHGFIAAGAIL